MIIVTGGAGFIGANLTDALVARGEPVIIVDDLTDGHKFINLSGLQIADYLDKDTFRQMIADPGRNPFGPVRAVFHQGACSATTEWDGRFMMDNNYAYSKELLGWCQTRGVPFIYASSAAVYGGNETFSESDDAIGPINVYGYSKWLFDQFIRARWSDLRAQVVGLRYFNVYGPREQHKGSMASVAFHLNTQLMEGDTIRLFEGSHGYADGEQQRDFVHVDDAVAVNLWFLDHPDISGIYNTGTGRSQSFNDVANAVIGWHGRGQIEYIPFPDHLKGAYQAFTQADLTELRKAGCDVAFRDVRQGVTDYMSRLNRHNMPGSSGIHQAARLAE